MEKTILNPKGVHPPPSDYSLAFRVDGKKMLFVSGQIPLDSSGNLVGRGDLRGQVKQVLENMKLVLAKMEAMSAGADEAILLDIQGFVNEAPGYNVVIVKQGKIYTHFADRGRLVLKSPIFSFKSGLFRLLFAPLPPATW